ncbi:MAG: hypothetical protein ACOC4L_04710 [Halanaerobium sp.]
MNFISYLAASILGAILFALIIGVLLVVIFSVMIALAGFFYSTLVV